MGSVFSTCNSTQASNSTPTTSPPVSAAASDIPGQASLPSFDEFMMTGTTPISISDLALDRRDCPICGVSYGIRPDASTAPELPIKLERDGCVFGEHCLAQWIHQVETQNLSPTCPNDRRVLYYRSPDEVVRATGLRALILQISTLGAWFGTLSEEQYEELRERHMNEFVTLDSVMRAVTEASDGRQPIEWETVESWILLFENVQDSFPGFVSWRDR